MRIFGIDPGTAITGYGCIDIKGNSVSWVDSGVIRTDSDADLPCRLSQIYDQLSERIGSLRPSRVCIEEAFYSKNVHTTLVLGHARGVAILAAYKYGAEISEYSPRLIKKSVTGNGNAEKMQVAYMIKMLLKPPTEHKFTDAYDALAVALCDFYNLGSAALKTAAAVKKR